ncbi:ABC transporter permease [Meiothermus granaticius]|uniref:Branched-chain amino acid transport system / permease component n=1 Tax=Meiothermus granaticius NBRC 107808 TaxID=1227551 RepID=A0A399F7A3_9DEIN|nr:ABC transporter permease [Meiothermus granaticius]MCL6528324.1 ABC transporter permease [Thermaceae bacterium]RIH91129.1 Branched-chain amino acid transport system / permease component [Meiothermus granaticius NBRC 107808]GEM86720.1 ABC transporter permease [Meiothermus granaticius NBRC 107808]
MNKPAFRSGRSVFGLRLEYDPSPPARRVGLVLALAIVAAFLAASLIFWAYGVSPVEVYKTLLGDTLGSRVGLAEVLRRAIPLILIGTGLTLALRGQFFNIGAEGQMAMGATAAAGVALFVPLPPPLTLPVMFLAGFMAGGAYALIAAWLKARLGVNEILTTLMLNYIAVYGVLYLVQGPWRGKSLFGFAFTDTFPPQAQLPTLPGTLVHWPTLILGVVLAVLLQVLLTRTTLGYAVRVVGENPKAAQYAGIPIARVVLLVALCSGGAAGLAGVGEVASIHKKLLDPSQITLGYGFTALIVAYLSRGNPILSVLTALLMAVIFAGGDGMKIAFQMPFRVVDVFSGLILLFIIASEPLVNYRLRRKPHG